MAAVQPVIVDVYAAVRLPKAPMRHVGEITVESADDVGKAMTAMTLGFGNVEGAPEAYIDKDGDLWRVDGDVLRDRGGVPWGFDEVRIDYGPLIALVPGGVVE